VQRLLVPNTTSSLVKQFVVGAESSVLTSDEAAAFSDSFTIGGADSWPWADSIGPTIANMSSVTVNVFPHREHILENTHNQYRAVIIIASVLMLLLIVTQAMFCFAPAMGDINQPWTRAFGPAQCGLLLVCSSQASGSDSQSGDAEQLDDNDPSLEAGKNNSLGNQKGGSRSPFLE